MEFVQDALIDTQFWGGSFAVMACFWGLGFLMLPGALVFMYQKLVTYGCIAATVVAFMSPKEKQGKQQVKWLQQWMQDHEWL
ncbi:hypothetical protein U1Q18_002837 [Sarracenia purpurea var. burkii]